MPLPPSHTAVTGGPRTTAKCNNCKCTWQWHRKWLRSSKGHETGAGYCSCSMFVRKDINDTPIYQPVRAEDEGLTPHETVFTYVLHDEDNEAFVGPFNTKEAALVYAEAHEWGPADGDGSRFGGMGWGVKVMEQP